MYIITHIDKFFHNSPGTEMYLGTPHFSGKVGIATYSLYTQKILIHDNTNEDFGCFVNSLVYG